MVVKLRNCEEKDGGRMACERVIGPYRCCSVVQGNCVNLMAELPDRSMDLVLTDPPYGIGKADWDKDVMPMLRDAAVSIRRIMTDQATCFWFHSIALLQEVLWATSPLRYRWKFIWYANNNMQHGALGFSKFASALVFGEGSVFHEMQDLISVPLPNFPIEEQPHPTVKTQKLIDYIVGKASAEGQTVLDPFLGSGTTAIAAKKLGRHFLGFEISPVYAELARKRIALVEAQPNLFEPKAEQMTLDAGAGER